MEWGECGSNGMKKFLWYITILGSLSGALVALAGVVRPTGAPEEAAAAAVGIALAVIPYCLARAASELSAKPAEPTPRVEQAAPPPLPTTQHDTSQPLQGSTDRLD